MKQTEIQIDQAGRVVLPKPLRERFHLRGGDTLTVAVKGEAIELRPSHPVGRVTQVNGVLVFDPPGRLSSDDFVQRSREDRINDVMGGAIEKE